MPPKPTDIIINLNLTYRFQQYFHIYFLKTFVYILDRPIFFSFRECKLDIIQFKNIEVEHLDLSLRDSQMFNYLSTPMVSEILSRIIYPIPFIQLCPKH